jgi:hypothetical protein
MCYGVKLRTRRGRERRKRGEKKRGRSNNKME